MDIRLCGVDGVGGQVLDGCDGDLGIGDREVAQRRFAHAPRRDVRAGDGARRDVRAVDGGLHLGNVAQAGLGVLLAQRVPNI